MYEACILCHFLTRSSRQSNLTQAGQQDTTLVFHINKKPPKTQTAETTRMLGKAVGESLITNQIKDLCHVCHEHCSHLNKLAAL